MVLLKPLSTEKAVRMLEAENKIAFIVERKTNKNEIKKEVERLFKVKVEVFSTEIRNNQKIAFVKLKNENLAIDVATKLGMM